MNRLCPGCGDLIADACPRCEPKAPSPRKRRLRRVYYSARFKRLKRRAHERDEWTCVDCGYIDETRQGIDLVADHEIPFDGPDDPLAWDLENIVTRCLGCSGRKDGGRRIA